LVLKNCSSCDEYINDVKLQTNINEVVLVDDELVIGGLVRSAVDKKSTGMIVQIISSDEVMVLWSVPPGTLDSSKKFGEIW
jgi:hypothetical protein